MTAQKDQDAPRRPGRPRGKKPGTANREQFDKLGILTSQKLRSIIKPAVEDGRLFREKDGKTTTFRRTI